MFTVALHYSSLLCFFPDWRLWPTDMGEIGGAARNKGMFASLFVCSTPPYICYFTVGTFSCLCFFFSVLCLFLMSLLILYYFGFPLSSHSLWLSLLRLPLVLSFVLFSLSLTMLPVLFQCFLLTLSSLPSWLGVTCPSVLSPSPSLLLHPSFPPPPLQFISLVSIQRGGRPSCCPTVHVCSPTL